uniref:Uncharacterized protein n=1 Tax=Anguilla anguilla TaxID=7936 RepID=A0A0E9W650_ANGAN
MLFKINASFLLIPRKNDTCACDQNILVFVACCANQSLLFIQQGTGY